MKILQNEGLEVEFLNFVDVVAQYLVLWWKCHVNSYQKSWSISDMERSRFLKSFVGSWIVWPENDF